MDKNDGGYVYSSYGMWKNASGSFDGQYVITRGITRRNWLAGLAMRARIQLDVDTSWEQMAERAYGQADIMIIEGEKNHG